MSARVIIIIFLLVTILHRLVLIHTVDPVVFAVRRHGSRTEGKREKEGNERFCLHRVLLHVISEPTRINIISSRLFKVYMT